MSAGLLRSNALGRAAEFAADPGQERLLYRALDTCDSGLAQLIYDAGAAGRLERGVLIDRGVSILWHNATVQVTDDLCDAQCRYMPRPRREGPVLPVILLTLFHESISRCAIAQPSLEAAIRRFAIVAAAQMKETRTTRWTYANSRQTALDLSGMLISGYFELLWSGTALSPHAHELGLGLGFALHIVSDIVSDDRRYSSLTKEEKDLLSRDARRALARLCRSKLSFLTNRVQSLVKKIGSIPY